MPFDKVVIATHADEALALLANPTTDETRLLGAWEYSKNHAVLHTDTSLMPTRESAWASWNYRAEKRSSSAAPVSVTYDMNRLQGLQTSRRYLVTLNTSREIPESMVIKKMVYTHPVYTFQSVATQSELPRLQGERNTYFCGSYFGYGFHEDAVKSGIAVAQKFGLDL